MNVIMGAVLVDYSAGFRGLQKTGSFDLSKYSNSLLDGSAVVEVQGRKALSREQFDICQERLIVTIIS